MKVVVTRVESDAGESWPQWQITVIRLPGNVMWGGGLEPLVYDIPEDIQDGLRNWLDGTE